MQVQSPISVNNPGYNGYGGNTGYGGYGGYGGGGCNPCGTYLNGYGYGK